MSFVTLPFFAFFVIIFIMYWWMNNKSLRWQNILLLVASYYFYSCWDWRFTFLLAFSTLLDFFTGYKIYESKTKFNRQVWLWISIIVNFGFLGIFKYYDFFASSMKNMLGHVGWHVNPVLIHIILPVGISFYTFHGISYVLDIYNQKIKPEKNIVDYSLFVSFFPLLVAGPIERATHLLPQLKVKRNFDYNNAVDGLKQMLWGLFKKIAVADVCAPIVEEIFSKYQTYSSPSLYLGIFYFAIQIYADFSGYTDIALGVSRLLGIELLTNFKYPYFSRSIAEFWRRWHISLSSWFRDYLYIPLGGSKGSKWQTIRNTFIIFLVSGFWHGASFKFIVWGGLHAIFILPSVILNKNRQYLEVIAKGKKFGDVTMKEIIQVAITFNLVLFAWVFFRAESLSAGVHYILRMFNIHNLHGALALSKKVFLLTGFMFLIDWLGRENKHALANLNYLKYQPLKLFLFYFIGLLILLALLFTNTQKAFIYFQF